MSRPNDASDTYFYNQKNERTFHRRLRKYFDDYTLFGEHKEQLLTFKGLGGDQDKEFANKLKRPSSSYKRVVVSLSSGLPSIDPAGPRLVSELEGGSERIQEEDEEDGASDVEAEKAEPRGRRGRLFTFVEAKFASTSILANLAKLLDSESSSAHITIPAYLVDDLLRNFDHLTCDVVFEKREWQTESSVYPDSTNASPYLTGQPEDEATRLRLESSVESVVRSQSSHKRLQQLNKNKKKRSKRSIARKKSGMEPSPPLEHLNRKPALERPMTALSVASNYSVRSDVSRASSQQHGEESPGRYEYDSLPTELRGTSPTILNYRREVHAVVPKPTRLEKLKMQKGSNQKSRRTHKISVSTGEKVEVGESQETMTEEPSDMSNVSSKHGGTLYFSISTCENEEWVVRPSEKDDMEASTLHQWDGQLLRLKEAMRKREEAQLTARLRGEDGPVIIKFYDIKSLRSKHQRSTSFPLPAVLSKLPPSVASFSPPTVNETLMIGEGAKLFLLILPDGSGHCNYFSGHEAVCISRREQDRRGVHTVAYEDSELHRMLACFGPDGRNCCYYPSGAIMMLTSEHGGTLFDENGHITRNWTWPDLKYKLPVSVSIQLNSCMSFHCTGLSNMVLRFSCHGQMNRFNVAPVPEIIEGLQQRRSDSTKGGVPNAGLLYSKSSPKLPQGEQVSSHGGPGNNEAINELITYRDKIRSVVDSWMAHYRQTIGITAPSPTLLPRPITSQTRLTQSKSMLGYLPDGDIIERGLSRASTRSSHAHHPTHPLSSCASSPFGMRTKSPPMEGEEGEGRALSPPIPRPVSPRDFIQSPPQPQAQKRASQVKAARTVRPNRVMCGCPVALHTLLLKGLDVMPPCKCDKRKAPNICDLEFDMFLQSHVPKEQLVVVVVLSSVIKDSCPYEPMLDDIHYSMNKLRYSPCVQCSTDPFRLLKYDLTKATRNLTYSVPLLKERHCVSSGMCLMYVGGQLLCADFMFNGYGTTRSDFMKQVQHSMDAGRSGKFLPRDYKFTNMTGSKVVSSKLWAYPVTGVMEDLIPFTPESHSETNLPPIAAVQELPRTTKNGPLVDILQVSSFTASKFSNLSESAISMITEDIT